jgi:hypothetical protein
VGSFCPERFVGEEQAEQEKKQEMKLPQVA